MSAQEQVQLAKQIQRALDKNVIQSKDNLTWLLTHMHPYFFITMKEEIQALVNLASCLHEVPNQRKIHLANRDKSLIIACADYQGSLYYTLKTLQERRISYAELSHSYEPLPGCSMDLEIQRFEFDRRSREEISKARDAKVPPDIKKSVANVMKKMYPTFDFTRLDDDLRLFWINNESYVRISPPERIARAMWLYRQGKQSGGLYVDMETTEDEFHHKETRLLFSVGNPPQTDFMTQVMEVFQRLKIGVRRSYSLNIHTGEYPYFLGTFYILGYNRMLVEKGTELYEELKTELYNTQILSASSTIYNEFVTKRIMSGEEASLTNAFISLCHTTLAHNQPDRFDLEAVKYAFHSDPEITLKLVDAFKKKFDPEARNREKRSERALKEVEKEIESYNTGQRYLDEIRKTVFRTCMLFIRHTLKTNFFVPEKNAISFRLDPAYLAELDPEFTSDLPEGIPFRVTFFFGRMGVGYHIGFSDIARGGWRTIICRNEDELLTNSNTLFREVFVLAHTQHFKNKDIYEGGSKLTVVLNASGAESAEDVTQLLYKTQHAFANAFLDIFVTKDGRAANPHVIDYYGEDEPIELGPDENMHDSMIEAIARLAVARGYLLGIGIMSSKTVGINHKEYGVTSRGVIKASEIAMNQLGINIHKDAFAVKITGGTNGDVAGNGMHLLVQRCPKAKIVSIAAGAGALYDPEGADYKELRKLVLKKDITDFNPKALHPGGFIVFRRQRRKEGLREMYRKLSRTKSAVKEEWITSDEFHKEFDNLIFDVPADLFLPCGGRPETIDDHTWQRLLEKDGTPAIKAIVEGANSYLTPEARVELQKKGVIVLRDASANKCGVISSSYEIIANLLMTEKEFLEHKEAYVSDVLDILDKRAEEEATLIFERREKSEGKLLYTEIANSISKEINADYAKLFAFFQQRPELLNEQIFRRVLLSHLPAFIRENAKFRARTKKLPPKIQYAILAAEIATAITYRGGWKADFEHQLRGFLRRKFS